MVDYTSTKAQLISALEARGARYYSDTKISCFHGDEHPSAYILHSDDGGWRYYCHSCGAKGDYWDISGSKPQKETPTMPTKTYTGQEVVDILAKTGTDHTTYRYADSKDQCVGLTVRLTTESGKTFRQFTPVGDKYAMCGPPKWVPYRLAEIRPGRLLIVEGEKCCDYARSLGINCTTWAGGSKAVSKTDWSLIKNDTIVLWADNDECGIQAMEGVAGKVAGDCVTMKPTGGKGDDICDYVGDAKTLVESYEVETAYDRLMQRSERVLAGELKPAGLESFPILQKLTQVTAPGTVNVLVGSAGGGKSTMLTQLSRDWLRKGVPFKTLMLESGVDFHLERAIGQEFMEGQWNDPEWRSKPANAERIRTVYAAGKGFISSMASSMSDMPPESATIDYVIEWVEGAAKSGAKAIVVDPITLISYPDVKAIAAGTRKLMTEVRRVAEQYECAIILVNHFTKGLNHGQPRTMQGGSSLTDHSDTVIELKSMPMQEEMDILTTGYDHHTTSKTVSRVLEITKARRGSTGYTKIGLMFRPESMTYTEQGIISPDQKGTA